MSSLHVMFMIAGTAYVVPAERVLHMESYVDSTPIPGAAPHRVVPVIDLRIRFGMPPIEPTLDSRVVVVTFGERTVGLLVDSAREVVNISPEHFKPPPEVTADGLVDAVAQIDRKLVLRLALAVVLGDVRSSEEHSDGEQRV
jgi:purine-binding chemotaxis protein CheW